MATQQKKTTTKSTEKPKKAAQTQEKKAKPAPAPKAAPAPKKAKEPKPAPKKQPTGAQPKKGKVNAPKPKPEKPSELGATKPAQKAKRKKTGKGVTVVGDPTKGQKTNAASKDTQATPTAGSTKAQSIDAGAKKGAPAQKVKPTPGVAKAAITGQTGATPAAAAKVGVAKKKKPSKPVTWLKFSLDCTIPVEDSILDPGSLEKFLQDKIKVGGKAGNLRDVVKISRDKAKIQIQAQSPFCKRYLKYLAKKYLKKQQLRDWLRVISTGKQGYQLKYFNIHDDDEEAPQAKE
eukprot:TRINITY_DN14853_c0_g1_i1.p1 TRINITY_DN14853_c0_g1~~TRINITY_DN14853_c0_g1_i1.p1  ORF type:complete len:290 (-),score=111.69 TRINITY_DN14853_c0_g1_i1:39-908(-)